jgi:hypothetical protein
VRLQLSGGGSNYSSSESGGDLWKHPSGVPFLDDFSLPDDLNLGDEVMSAGTLGSAFETFLVEGLQRFEPMGPRETEVEELRWYREQEAIGMQECPFAWWRARARQAPKLARVASRC